MHFQTLRQSIGGCLNSFFAFITTIAVDYYIMLPGLILFWAVNKRSGLIAFYWTVIMEPIGKAVGIGIVHFFLQASAPFLFMTAYPFLFRLVESRAKPGDA